MRRAILSGLSEYKSSNEIINIVKENHDTVIARNTISWYLQSKKWRPVIDENRQRWSSDLSGTAIAQGKWRLGEIDKILTDVRKENPKLALRALTEARKEITEGKLDITGDINHKHHILPAEFLTSQVDHDQARREYLTGKSDKKAIDAEIVE